MRALPPQTSPTIALGPDQDLKTQLHATLDSIQVPNLKYCTDEKAQLNTVDAFQVSPEFAPFKQATLRALMELHDHTRTTFQEPVFNKSNWGQLACRLGLQTGEFYNELRPDLYRLYVHACPCLQRIAATLTLLRTHHTGISDSTRRQAQLLIEDLTRETGVCGPGLCNHIQHTTAALQLLLDPPKLGEYFKTKREATAKQIILEFVKLHLSDIDFYTYTEVHLVATFQNAMARKFNLPMVIDRHIAPPQLITMQNHLPDLEEQLSKALSLDAIAIQMSHDILDELRQSLQGVNTQDDKAVFDHLTEHLNGLTQRFGNIRRDYVAVAGEGQTPTEIANSPTLLARHLLDLMLGQGLERNSRMNGIEQHGWGESETLHIGRQLAWVSVRRGIDCEHRLLELADIANPGFSTLKTVNKPESLYTIVQEALSNTPFSMQRYFMHVRLDAMEPQVSGMAMVAGLGLAMAETPLCAANREAIEKIVHRLADALDYMAPFTLLTSPQRDLLPPKAIQQLLNLTADWMMAPSGLEPDMKFNGTPLTLLVVQARRADCLRVLLQRGADVDKTDRDGNTALHFAALRCALSTTRLHGSIAGKSTQVRPKQTRPHSD